MITLVVLACDPVGGAEAIIVDSTGAPIPDATATLFCPAPNKTRSEPTDATGRFYILAIAMDDDSCVLTLEKPGFVTKKLPVDAACRSPNKPKCKDKPTRITLERSP